MIDDELVLLLKLIADFNDGMHHATTAFRHVLSQILKLLLQCRDIALDVGCQRRQLVADCADKLLGEVATEHACAHILTTPADEPSQFGNCGHRRRPHSTPVHMPVPNAFE
jgi:hypothetical protein